jgi:hypothetical protein
MSLEQQIETTMARAADGIGAAGFTAEEILHKGRSARVRRRARRTAAGVAAVVLAVVATLTVINLPSRTRGVAPVGPPTQQVWPFPTSPAQSGPSPQSLGISLANGQRIVPAYRGPARGPIHMSLPPGAFIVGGLSVLGGWVVKTQTGFDPTVSWYQPEDGSAPTKLASNVWAYSRDRGYLVVAGAIEPTLTAYSLPTMSKVADTRIPRDDNATNFGLQIVGDSAYVSYTLHGVTPVRMARWDLTTFIATNLGQNVFSWGTSGDSVLRSADNGDESCVDMVPIPHFADGGSSGVCSTYLDRAGAVLSPDGRQAVIVSDGGEPLLLVNTEDLHAGVWRPTTVTGVTGFLAWVSPTSFLGYDDGAASPVLLCTGPDTCSPIGLPAGEPWITFLRDDLS